jgi:predicted unusual protein kinase regulating ubiquinone biosynthesis (AarF/ABC1/UbiB family)
VMVKVQYPGVDRSIDSDLAQLKLALRAAGLLKLERKVANELFVELSRQLHEELDYTREAENVRRFREIFAGGEHPQVVVPEVVDDLSTRRVLTLTFEPGTSLADVTPEAFDQRERDLIGRTLLRMVFDQVFTHGLLHADPNPANYAVRPGGVVVLYDFGCVKQLPEHAVDGFRLVFRGLLAADPDLLERGLIDLGARDPARSVSWQQYRALLGIFGPLMVEGPFDFGRGDLGAQLFALVSNDRSLVDGFRPPVQAVFVNRVLVGQHGTLRRMGARVNLRQLVEPHLAA